MSSKLFRIDLIQPEFDELYEKYRAIYDTKTQSNTIAFGKDNEKEKPVAVDRSADENQSPPKKPKYAAKGKDFDWGNLTLENLKLAQKVVEITINFLQFRFINRLTSTVRIPLQRFESQHIYFDDVLGVLGRVGGVEIKNGELWQERREWERTRVRIPGDDVLDDLLLNPPGEKDLAENIFLDVATSDGLHDVKSIVDRVLEDRLRTHGPAGEQPHDKKGQLDAIQGRLDKSAETEALVSEALARLNPNNPAEAYPDTYGVSVRDREIWINGYLVGKPHAVGSNLEFFEYVRSKPNTPVQRDDLPETFGNKSLKERVRTKSFTKILNELGFKGEALKAFFPGRGKDAVTYRGDTISKADLEKAGVKTALFLKELELAHIKNSPG